MRLEDFTGKSIDDIERVLDEQSHLLVLDDPDPDNLIDYILCLYKQHGARAGAFAIASALFIKQRGSFESLGEAVALWREAAEHAEGKFWRRKKIILDIVRQMSSHLSWAQGFVPDGSLKDVERNWPVIFDKVSSDEVLSLGNFIVWMAIITKSEDEQTSRMIGYSMVGHDMKDMLAKLRRMEKRRKKSV